MQLPGVLRSFPWDTDCQAVPPDAATSVPAWSLTAGKYTYTTLRTLLIGTVAHNLCHSL